MTIIDRQGHIKKSVLTESVIICECLCACQAQYYFSSQHNMHGSAFSCVINLEITFLLWHCYKVD
jgi:hypothetical protein